MKLSRKQIASYCESRYPGCSFVFLESGLHVYDFYGAIVAVVGYEFDGTKFEVEGGLTRGLMDTIDSAWTPSMPKYDTVDYRILLPLIEAARADRKIHNEEVAPGVTFGTASWQLNEIASSIRTAMRAGQYHSPWPMPHYVRVARMVVPVLRAKQRALLDACLAKQEAICAHS